METSVLEGFPLSVLASLWRERRGGRLVILLPTEETARELYQDLKENGETSALYFPLSGKTFYSKEAISPTTYEQVRILSLFCERESGVLVLPLRAFSAPCISRNTLERLSFPLKVGSKFESSKLSSLLASSGYIRSSSCYEAGTYSMRGEIAEIFPYGEENPIRIYISWDEIEKIAIYESMSQKPIKTLSAYNLSLLSADKEVETAPFTSYLSDEDYLILAGRERLEVTWRSLLNEAKSLFKAAYAEDAEALVPERLLTSPFAYIEGRRATLVVSDVKKEGGFNFDIGPARSYFGNFTFFKEELESLLENKWNVTVVAPSQVQYERLETVLRDFEGVKITIAGISRGFSIDSKKLLVILDQEIFGRKRVRTREHIEKLSSAPIDSFVDLKEGDYVVHINYGIGKFVKIERVKTSRSERDYIKILYADEEYIYVPIEQADLVQRYIGTPKANMKLDKVGGSGWSKKKEKALKSAEELASQLVRLYAQRENSFGYPFLPDNDWQVQFEAGFPFDETPDQLKCIEEVKKDMESDKVMDRLICGDVGYGKTEIAFRAVFKAVMSGKQVAFLAPTTILAEQHWRTFKERLGDFPVRSVQLSRIVSSREVKKIILGLADGTIDVVFGTHKILQKSVVFKNLGLLVIDEEQRFGVKDKEKIKQLKQNVDCLTLSATPIPRTLYMSLLKVRDMSLLTTAPHARLPVKTYITDFNMDLVAEAVRKELERGGQVFYLHNKVEDLKEIAYQIHSLLPSAIVESAHGQMDGEELEDIMRRFVYEGVQVLVSTTIIENGIDIPNVNTIIIDHAERFGLSQLYQLRGRVGRSDRQAYCYLLYPDKDALNDDAVKRLKVLSENTALGSGFKVAMKDMEIRGAGNILGREQSGQLEAVGLDLYMKILDEEINRLTQGEKQTDREVYLELDYSGFIPDSYISDPSLKLEMYKKLSSIKTDYELEALQDELESRFGPIVEEVESLLSIARLKIICRKLEIYHLSESRGIVQIEFGHLASINPNKLINLLKLSGGKVKMDSRRMNYMRMETDAVSLNDKALFIIEKLKRLL